MKWQALFNPPWNRITKTTNNIRFTWCIAINMCLLNIETALRYITWSELHQMMLWFHLMINEDVQGWGLLIEFSRFRYFPHFLLLSKQTLAIEYHVYIWQVSPQLSCGDTCQIWMWFRESNRCFCKIVNFAYGEISERSFSNPHPCSVIQTFGPFLYLKTYTGFGINMWKLFYQFGNIFISCCHDYILKDAIACCKWFPERVEKLCLSFGWIKSWLLM